MTNKTKTVALSGKLFADSNFVTGKITYTLLDNRYSWLNIPDEAIVIEENCSVEVTIPDLTQEEFRIKAIQTLKAKQAQIMAESQKELLKLQDRIDALMFLEHKPE